MHENTSESLLNRYLGGSETASFELFQRYENRLIGLAQTRIFEVLKSKIAPEDIAQETFQTFFQLADRNDIRWQKRGDLWRLLAGIAINNVRRTHEHFSQAKRNVVREVSLNQFADVLNRASPDATEELSELVEQLFGTLKPLEQKIVNLRLAGYDNSEIAKEISRSPRTVRRILESVKSSLIAQNHFDFLIEPLPRKSNDYSTPVVRYEDLVFLRMLGQGSFAKVYLARHNLSQELYAVKAIRKKWLPNVAVHDSFTREIAILKTIDHPSVPKIFGTGSLPNGGCFLLMEYIQGEPFATAASNASAMQLEHWKQSLNTTIKMLHDSGIVHRDIRKENLMIDQHGSIRLVDFGLGALNQQAVQDDPNTGMRSDLTAVRDIFALLCVETGKSSNCD